MPGHAKNVPTAVRRASDNSVFCRAIGHAWVKFPTDDWEPQLASLQYKPMSFQCQNCGTVRRDLWQRGSGILQNRVYVYPDGYVLGHLNHGERTAKETFRAEFIEREE